MGLKVHRLFLDANVLVAGSGSPGGGSGAILRLLEFNIPNFQGVVSQQVLVEAERNIKRKLPRGMKRYQQIVANIRLEVQADPSREDILRCAELISSKDAPILAAAINTRADLLITLDTRHFMTDQLKAASLSMNIVTPGEFLRDHLPSLISTGGSGMVGGRG